MGKYERSTPRGPVRMWMLIDPAKQGRAAVAKVCKQFDIAFEERENKYPLCEIWVVDIPGSHGSFEMVLLEPARRRASLGGAYGR